jgi:hypothetical protein
LKIKLKGRHFDTIEVIEAESQAVLNTLTNTRMHLKYDRSPGDSVYARKELLRGWWWPVSSKLVFYQMAAPAAEIMASSYIYIYICIYIYIHA